jgi:1,4-dihydroxy-2-naphthoate polyprenyltransferase
MLLWVSALPPLALLSTATVPSAWCAHHGAVMHANDIPALLPATGWKVGVDLLTPTLLAAGLSWLR